VDYPISSAPVGFPIGFLLLCECCGIREMRTVLKLLVALLIGAPPLAAQSVQDSSVAAQPRNATYCEIAKDPKVYNHEFVRLSAFLTHGFEDFGLAEPNCPAPPVHFSIWVMYGGKAESNTAYCCPGETGGEQRSEPLVVEGIKTPLESDAMFQQFTDLLKRERDTTVRVTVVGRFFSGKKLAINGSTYWRGFGHLGCCSLFVIQRVERFEPHTRSDLDYTSEAGWYEKEGCKASSFRWVRHISISDGTAEQAIGEQRLADGGAQAWAFDDPRRVAVESLKPYYKDQVPTLREITKSPERQVFSWRNGKKSIAIVVIRPYWLSFYASGSAVAWVSTTIKEADCDLVG
jgi:hypothetical protein